MTDPQLLSDQGKQAFAKKEYEQAVQLFRKAVSGFEADNRQLDAAETKNNLSVALLQIGKAQEAFEAVAGTDSLFAKNGDGKHQAMALGNQAAALAELKKYDLALERFEQSAALFGDVEEDELRSVVLQSAAALKLRRGKILDSALSMIGSAESAPNPTLVQRFLKFLLRLKS